MSESSLVNPDIPINYRNFRYTIIYIDMKDTKQKEQIFEQVDF